MKTIVNLLKSLKKQNETISFPNGSIVEYINGSIKVYPTNKTKVTLYGPVHFYSEEDIIIESLKSLKLRGLPVHFNDDKPAHLFDDYQFLEDNSCECCCEEDNEPEQLEFDFMKEHEDK